MRWNKINIIPQQLGVTSIDDKGEKSSFVVLIGLKIIMKQLELKARIES